jgi:hypothetical protein
MTAQYRGLMLGGLLACGLGLPVTSFALSGCNNGYLSGTYNVTIGASNFQQALQTMSASATTGSAASGGLTGAPTSLSGNLPGLGRFYFDGAGTIVGTQTATSGNVYSAGVGTYTVNLDCTAKLTLASGQTYDAVIVNHGRQALFLETDAAGAGASGKLELAGPCVALNSADSFGFSFSGATQQAASTGTGTTGSTGTTAAAFTPYSAIGTITTDGNGSFTMSQSVYQNGAVTRGTAQGSYTVGTDCSLQLKFAPQIASSTGAPANPALLRGLVLNNAGGSLIMQPDSSDVLSGAFIAQ